MLKRTGGVRNKNVQVPVGMVGIEKYKIQQSPRRRSAMGVKQNHNNNMLQENAMPVTGQREEEHGATRKAEGGK